MTGNDFRRIRKGWGLGRSAFAWALGYKGNYNTVSRMVVRTEALHDRPIPGAVAERVRQFLAKEGRQDEIKFEQPPNASP